MHEAPQLSSELYGQIRNALVTCEPLASDRQLRAFFGDPRLRPWRDHLQSAPDPVSRAEMVIDLLQRRYSGATGENGLALLLRALAERHPGDALATRLANLADDVEAAGHTDVSLDGDFLVPFLRNPDFVGRNEDLERLHEALQGEKGNRPWASAPSPG